LLRDDSGEKMSKLRGNVVNPIEAISQYGVDALRFALTIGSSPGNDVNLGAGRLESSRNFVNKLWNATRFTIQNMRAEALKGRELGIAAPVNIEDCWINGQFNRLVENVTNLLEDFQFGEAEQQIYDFARSKFCDWYIEIAKMRLRDQSMPSPLPFLIYTLEKLLRLLHPFMPFITEELWQLLKQSLPNKSQMPASIMIASYPTSDNKATDPEAEQVMDSVIEIIRSIRNARAQYKVEPAKWIEARIYADKFLSSLVSENRLIEELAKVQPLTILSRQDRKPEEGKALALVLKETEVVLPWAGMVDQLAEKRRLGKEVETTRSRIAQLDARLEDNAFLTKAPSHVIENEKQKLDMLKDKIKRLYLELSQLGF